MAAIPSDDIPAAAVQPQSPSSDKPSSTFSTYVRQFIIRKRTELTPTVITELNELITTATEHRISSQHQKSAEAVFNMFEMLGIDWLAFDEFKLKFRPLIIPVDSAEGGSTNDGEQSEEDGSPNADTIVKRFICAGLYELSIVLFYIPAPNAKKYNLWITQVVEMNPLSNSGHAASARRNYQFNLTILNGVKISLSVDLDRYPSTKRYSPMNPSMLKCGDGYLVNLRMVNYHMVDGIHYVSNDEDKIIRTKNFLMGLDRNLKVLWDIEVVDRSPTPRKDWRVKGLEDCRIFWLPTVEGVDDDMDVTVGKIIDQRIDPSTVELEETRMVKGEFSAVEIIENEVKAEVHRHSKSYLGFDLSRLGVSTTTFIRAEYPQVSVGRYNPMINENNQVEIEQLIPMVNEERLRGCEKNWVMYAEPNHRCHFIYSHHPLTMVEARPVNDWMAGKKVFPMQTVCPVSLRKDQPLRTLDHRGSSSPIEYVLWKNAVNEIKVHLICVHSVIFKFNQTRRFYYDKLLAYDMQWNLIAISKPFNLIHEGIEYCSGMILDHSGENILFTLGVEDKEAYIVSIKTDDIDAIMYPIDHLRLEVDF